MRALEKRIEAFLATHRAPGLRGRASRERFVRELTRALAGQRRVTSRWFEGSVDVADSDFHAYKAIRQLAAKDKEEAIWLSFLTTACGPLDGQDRWRTVRALYGRLGEGAGWSWELVARAPGAVRQWMVQHRDEVIRLRFGNHRKFETHDPEKRNSTADVIESYVRRTLWITTTQATSWALLGHRSRRLSRC